MNHERSHESYVQSETRAMCARPLNALETDVLMLSNALGGEVGELQNVITKMLRDGTRTDTPTLFDPTLSDQFVLEAGDSLWYLTRLIQKMGFTLPMIEAENVKKLELRKAEP